MKGLIPRAEAATVNLLDVVERLSVCYDPVPPVLAADPFELILSENVAYLANDDRRREAMDLLRKTVGITPEAVLRATSAGLLAAARFGILPENSVKKMRAAAEIAERDFGGDLTTILDLPVAKAKRALRRFPGIGEPGAEKILLYFRRHASLAPDSNALRVLVRLGLCRPGQSYTRTYAAGREVGLAQIGEDIDRLTAARHLLRRHGQQTCRATRPMCGKCIIAGQCPSAGAG